MTSHAEQITTLIEDLRVDLRLDELNANVNDDNRLTILLSRSMAYLDGQMGVVVDYVNDLVARELLFNRVRYDYNSALEYWNDNFHGELLALQLKYGVEDNATTI